MAICLFDAKSPPAGPASRLADSSRLLIQVSDAKPEIEDRCSGNQIDVADKQIPLFREADHRILSLGWAPPPPGGTVCDAGAVHGADAASHGNRSLRLSHWLRSSDHHGIHLHGPGPYHDPEQRPAAEPFQKVLEQRPLRLARPWLRP